jgi:hypothetical protein
MLKKLVIFLVLVGFVVSAASYMTGFISLFPGGNGNVMFGSPENLVITMSILTDTETYHSGEYMEARVFTACNNDLDSVIVRIYGIKDNFGKYRINEEKIVRINSPGNETVFLVRMPSCYGCAGISPGEYNLTTELIYSDEVIGNTSKTITLAK